MKILIGSRRHRYAAKLASFLIVVALIAGIAGCAGDGDGGPYTLTMAVAPPGSGTATDLTGASPYAANTTVNITAAADPGYRFANWTAPAGAFGNQTATTTTFTMPAQNVMVTANFAALYDLTMAVAGGNGTATDLTNASPYTAGTPVSVQAVADPGYRFVNWTAPDGTFGNQTATTTTFTMPAQNVTVTANLAPFAGGSGTGGDPYQIADWHQLHNVRNYMDSYFILVNNLDSNTAGYTELANQTANSGKGWQPIGDYTSVNFTGTFDGQGYEIKDLFINRPSEDYVGLFGAVDVGGAVKNVGVVDGTVSGDWYVGGLVGRIDGIVSNSYSTCNVTGYCVVGGLVGCNYGTASNCSAAGDVSASWRYAGGLAGINQGNVSSCYATGDVTGGGHTVGGLMGRSDPSGTVDNCYSTGNVSGYTYVGGLMGENRNTVSNSYSTGKVNGNNGVGGLIGKNDGIVSNAYSTCNVTGSSGVGGLVGYNSDTVSNSFWDTQTSGQNSSAGGTGKNTTEMKDITTFSGATWNITTVSGIGERNITYIWNIVDSVTYAFLSWQPV